mgnify:CR=1 FL=1
MPVFGGVADGIIVDDFGFGALFANFADESADTVNGLGGLGDDAEAFDIREIGDVIPDLEGLVGKVTRFAIDDFSPAEPGEDAASPPAPGTRADLLLRVQSLERAVEQLKKTDGGDVR